MTERDDVEREIEENERRVRDEQDVGLDEDVVQAQERDSSLLGDLDDALSGDGDDSGERDRRRRQEDSGS